MADTTSKLPEPPAYRIPGFGKIIAILMLSIISGTSAPLGNIADIRKLSSSETAGLPPLSVDGQIISKDRINASAIVASGEDAVWVKDLEEEIDTFSIGDFARITGRLGPGLYAPEILADGLAVTGHAPLPYAPVVGYHEFASARYHCRLVRLRGICRSWFKRDIGSAIDYGLELDLDGMIVPCEFLGGKPAADLESLVDAEIELTGVAVARFNLHGQMVTPVLRMGKNTEVKILAAATEPPLIPVDSLFTFRPGTKSGHRVRVRGTVVMSVPGVAVFIREGDQALKVSTFSEVRYRPGELLEIAGFPARGSYRPSLEDGRIIARKPGAPVAPVTIESDDLGDGRYEADLVSLEAVYHETVTSANQRSILLSAGDLSIKASVPETWNPGELNPGSVLKVTGILEASEVHRFARTIVRPASFELRVGDAGDISIISSPPRLYIREILTVLAFLAAAFIVSVIWVTTLRRQVTAKAEIISEQTAVHAAQDERNRIAGEFHDTLEQQLLGIRLQLESAVSALGVIPEIARRPLALAARMIRLSLSETRESIHGLRSSEAIRLPLSKQLEFKIHRLTESLSTDRPPETTFRIIGTEVRIRPIVEMNLLRIGQEAAANALRHSGCENLTACLAFEPDSVVLTIEDDGSGFDYRNPPSPTEGHFGLVGMRERANRISGVITLTNGSQGGTLVRVAVPLT